MLSIARTDHSVLGRWWWTVDHWTLAALAMLIGMGTLLITAASPAVADRIGLPHYHFVNRHLIMLLPAAILMIGASMLQPRQIRRLAIAMLLASIALMIMTLMFGAEVKGAQRWLHFAGFTLQPSEFAKPALVVVSAWLFSLHRSRETTPGIPISAALLVVVMTLLLMQPDLGMAFIVAVTWAAQYFLAGMPLIAVAAFGVLSVAGLVVAYFTFPHVSSRIDRFFDPSTGDSYQIQRSLDAFAQGGIFGTGPGQGTVKFQLPDAHADFVFAVAGEELGLLWCTALVLLFAFVVIRGLLRVLNRNDLFVVIAAAGLLIQFGLQALVHMASSVHLMPTKGMTLPLISYGGSSLLAVGIGLGMMLALTRTRYGSGEAQ